MSVALEPFYERVDRALSALRRSPSPQHAGNLDALLQEAKIPLGFHIVVPGSGNQFTLDEYALDVFRRMTQSPSGYFLLTGQPHLPSNDALGEENPVATQLRFSQGKVETFSGNALINPKRFYMDLYIPVKRIILVREAMSGGIR